VQRLHLRQRHDAVGVAAVLLRLRERRDDAAVQDERGQHVHPLRLAMVAANAELASEVLVPHVEGPSASVPIVDTGGVRDVRHAGLLGMSRTVPPEEAASPSALFGASTTSPTLVAVASSGS
jgi:hypothetical protein